MNKCTVMIKLEDAPSMLFEGLLTKFVCKPNEKGKDVEYRCEAALTRVPPDLEPSLQGIHLSLVRDRLAGGEWG